MNLFFLPINIDIDTQRIAELYYSHYHDLVQSHTEDRRRIFVYPNEPETSPQIITPEPHFLPLLHPIIDAFDIELPFVKLFIWKPDTDFPAIHIDTDDNRKYETWGINIPIGAVGGLNNWYLEADNPDIYNTSIYQDLTTKSTDGFNSVKDKVTWADWNKTWKISETTVIRQPTLYRTNIFHDATNKGNPNYRVTLSLRTGVHSSKHPSWETIYNKISEYNRTH